MPPTNNNKTYCDYSENEYYNIQGEICIPCDRCMLGLGLASIEQRKFDIDPIHGALGCRHCVPCPKGFYSQHYTYEECQPCTDCVKDGRSENVPCNPKQNAVCGNLIQNRSAEIIYLGIGLGFAGILAVIIVIVVYECLKRKRTRRQDKRICATEGDESAKAQLISTDSGSSSLSTASKSSSDIETDAAPGFDTKPSSEDKIKQWKQSHVAAINAVLSDRHARMISPSIAGAKVITDVGLSLGLPDSSIKIIKENHYTDVVTQAYETLIKWKQTKASDATVSNFLDALLSLQLYNIATEFCEKYKLESSF